MALTGGVGVLLQPLQLSHELGAGGLELLLVGGAQRRVEGGDGAAVEPAGGGEGARRRIRTLGGVQAWG